MQIPDTRIIIAALWACLMFTYLLGDVLRIFSGDFVPGKIDGQTATPVMWMAAALIMLVPIVMIFLSLVMDYPIIRWVVIVASVGLFLFNLVALPTYPSAYDRFLIVVGLVFNLITVWYAWGWEL